MRCVELNERTLLFGLKSQRFTAIHKRFGVNLTAATMLFTSARYVGANQGGYIRIKTREATIMMKGADGSSSFGVKCVHCSNELLAPERSEYWNERHVNHLWHCSKCDCCFETAVLISADSSADSTPMDNKPPLLVA